MSDTPETTNLLSTKKALAAEKKADLLNLLTWASENGDPEHKAIARSLLPQPKPPKPIKKKPLDMFREALGALFDAHHEVLVEEALNALSLPSLEAYGKIYKKHLDREEEGRLWIREERRPEAHLFVLLGKGPTPPGEWTGYVPLRRKA